MALQTVRHVETSTLSVMSWICITRFASLIHALSLVLCMVYKDGACTSLTWRSVVGGGRMPALTRSCCLQWQTLEARMRAGFRLDTLLELADVYALMLLAVADAESTDARRLPPGHAAGAGGRQCAHAACGGRC